MARSGRSETFLYVGSFSRSCGIAKLLCRPGGCQWLAETDQANVAFTDFQCVGAIGVTDLPVYAGFYENRRAWCGRIDGSLYRLPGLDDDD